jgi:hypothetical protein
MRGILYDSSVHYQNLFRWRDRDIWKHPLRVHAAKLDVASHDMINNSQVIFCSLPNDFPGYSHDNLAVGNLGVRSQYCTGRDDAPLTDFASVQDDSPRRDQSSRPNTAAMHDGPVPNPHPVCNIEGHSALDMNDGSVLNIDPGPDSDGCNIPPDHHMVHDGGLIADMHVSADKRSLGYINVSAEHGFDERLHDRILLEPDHIAARLWMWFWHAGYQKKIAV